MKIKCKKCGITLESNNMDFHDVARYSALQCMDEGTHVFVGVVGASFWGPWKTQIPRTKQE